MDVLNALGGFIKQNGLVGTLLLLFVLDKLKMFDKIGKFFKRNNEDHPHRRSEDNEDIIHFHRRDKDDIVEVKKMINEQISKQVTKDIEMAIMKNDLTTVKENVEKIFELMSQMKDMMIKMGYGKR